MLRKCSGLLSSVFWIIVVAVIYSGSTKSRPRCPLLNFLKNVPDHYRLCFELLLLRLFIHVQPSLDLVAHFSILQQIPSLWKCRIVTNAQTWWPQWAGSFSFSQPSLGPRLVSFTLRKSLSYITDHVNLQYDVFNIKLSGIRVYIHVNPKYIGFNSKRLGIWQQHKYLIYFEAKILYYVLFTWIGSMNPCS